MAGGIDGFVHAKGETTQAVGGKAARHTDENGAAVGESERGRAGAAILNAAHSTAGVCGGNQDLAQIGNAADRSAGCHSNAGAAGLDDAGRGIDERAEDAGAGLHQEGGVVRADGGVVGDIAADCGARCHNLFGGVGRDGYFGVRAGNGSRSGNRSQRTKLESRERTARQKLAQQLVHVKPPRILNRSVSVERYYGPVSHAVPSPNL